MTSSPARIAANRRNAAKSTGPRTSEGKQTSRANALKHGLAAETLRTADEEAAVAAIPLDQWCRREALVLAERIERAHRVEERERDHAALRAETCWDADRRREADQVGLGLARRPERVVARLRETVQGCDWLITRWEWLRAAAGRPGGWTADHAALARNLRGEPAAFGDESPAVADPAALAIAEITALRATRVSLEPADRFGRESARKGLDDAATPALRRAIRYAADLFRRLRWCLDVLPADEPAPPAPEPAPAPAKPPVAPPPPRPALPPLAEPVAQDPWIADRRPVVSGAWPTSWVPLSITPSPVPRR